MGSLGCLLPLLIIFNLFFGKLIFNSNGLWLGVEVVLVLIFMLKIKLMASRISQHLKSEGRVQQSHEPQGSGLGSSSQSHEPQGSGLASSSQSHKPPGKVVDIQGQVVEDDKELR